jgi:hypothetical protein
MTQELLGNRFRILGELGHGAMGAVYHVVDTLDGDKEMALKRIHVAGAITPELKLRFKEEFRAMVRLEHPNTIRVLGYGPLDDTTQYLTMELVPGTELVDLARGSVRLPLERVYDVLVQLLQALAFIHSRFYVHRDVKAQNIRLTPEGRLKLLDFGLMVRAGTPAGAVTGTPGYLAPEFLRGGTVTAQGDLYAVGCLAFELVTGRLPFEGGVREVLRAHLHESPPRLKALAPHVPAALDQLVHRLLAKDPADRHADAAEVLADLSALSGLVVTRGDLDQRKSYLVASAMVGREAELAELESGLRAAREGQGRAVFLGAPAGVGKSRLLGEVLLQAQVQDALVLTGRCLENGVVPLAPIAQALSPLLSVTTEAERSRYMPALARLYPAQFGAPEGAAPLSPQDLHAAVIHWMRAVSERVPIVMAIEDLHWADAATLAWLNAVTHHLADAAILLVATFRPDETPPGSGVWVSIHEGWARWLPLGPLTEAQVVQMVEAMLRRVALPAAFGPFLYGATAGNAFYVTEMLRYMMEEGILALRDGVWHLPEDLSLLALPATVEDTVLRRLQQLSPVAREVASTAAVLGWHQDRTVLLSVGSLEEEALFAALDELVERQFLVIEQDRYAFPQNRVRDVLYAELEPERRRDTHERIAGYLEAAEDPEGVLAELAYHFSRAGRHDQAFAYLRRWGEKARGDGQFSVAVAAWLEAVEQGLATAHPDKDALLAELRLNIGIYGFSVAPREAIEALDLAFPHYEAAVAEHGDEAARGTLSQCLAALANAYGYFGEPAVSLAMADLLAAQDHGDSAPMRGAARAAYCSGLLASGHFDALAAAAGEAMPDLAGVDLAGCPPLVHAARVIAVSDQNAAAYQGYRPDDGLRDYALWAAADSHMPHFINHVLHHDALWAAWTGREDEALAVVEEMVATSRRLGAPPDPHVLYVRPYLLWQRGELDDAAVLVKRALQYPHLDQNLMARRLIEVLSGTLQLDLGDLEGAMDTLRPIEAQAQRTGMDFVRMQALLPLGRLLIQAGDAARGLAALETAAAMSGSGPARNPLVYALALAELADAAIAAGDPERAQALVTSAFAIASDPSQDNRALQARLKACQAEIHAATARPDLARQANLEALAGYKALRHATMQHRLQERLANPVAPAPRIEAPQDFRIPAWLQDAESRRPDW